MNKIFSDKAWEDYQYADTGRLHGLRLLLQLTNLGLPTLSIFVFLQQPSGQ
jgi:hypothetical protein